MIGMTTGRMFEKIPGPARNAAPAQEAMRTYKRFSFNFERPALSFE
jgi:hypothetical protein